jgi:hypothetical protein
VAVAPPPTRANSWEDVADLSRSFGVELDQWQEVVLQAAMGERADGTWSAKQVGLSAPRQNGKSQLIVARALAGALLFDEKKIVISAHSQDTARETFGKFIEQIDNSPALAERIDKVMNALNREFIKFKNGAVIQFKARTVSGSRGFSSDCLLLDEAQILGMPAWVSINSTMSARPNPQIWLLGTPPTPEDNGEVFTSIRTAAIGGRSRTLAWLEWSALPTDDPALVETRAKANPAWNSRINHEIVQGEYETYPPERFALDRLGIWRSDSAALVMPNWVNCLSSGPRPSKVAAIALAVDQDRVWISLAACMAGEVLHLGSVERVRLDRDRARIIAEVARIQAEHGCAVALDRKGPGASLETDLATAGVTVTAASLDDYVRACADLFDAVESKQVEHGGYAELDDAVTSATKRPVGDRWAWSRRSGDVSMLEAATLALWASAKAPTYDVLDSIF